MFTGPGKKNAMLDTGYILITRTESYAGRRPRHAGRSFLTIDRAARSAAVSLC